MWLLSCHLCKVVTSVPVSQTRVTRVTTLSSVDALPAALVRARGSVLWLIAAVSRRKALITSQETGDTHSATTTQCYSSVLTQIIMTYWQGPGLKVFMLTPMIWYSVSCGNILTRSRLFCFFWINKTCDYWLIRRVIDKVSFMSWILVCEKKAMNE